MTSDESGRFKRRVAVFVCVLLLLAAWISDRLLWHVSEDADTNAAATLPAPDSAFQLASNAELRQGPIAQDSATLRLTNQGARGDRHTTAAGTETAGDTSSGSSTDAATAESKPSMAAGVAGPVNRLESAGPVPGAPFTSHAPGSQAAQGTSAGTSSLRDKTPSGSAGGGSIGNGVAGFRSDNLGGAAGQLSPLGVPSGLMLDSFPPGLNADGGGGSSDQGLLGVDNGSQPGGGHPNDPSSGSGGTSDSDGAAPGAGTGPTDPGTLQTLDQTLGDSGTQQPGGSPGNGGYGGNHANPPVTNHPETPSASVPEPSALLLLSLGIGVTLRRWKRLRPNHHTC